MGISTEPSFIVQFDDARRRGRMEATHKKAKKAWRSFRGNSEINSKAMSSLEESMGPVVRRPEPNSGIVSIVLS